MPVTPPCPPPAKRQRGENRSTAPKSTTTTTVVQVEQNSRASDIRSRRDRPILHTAEWTLGTPLPPDQLPVDVRVSGRFTPQETTQVSDDLVKAAHLNWALAEGKTRPRFARLLFAETVQSNARLLAAYLGFDTVTELYIFVDFEVPKVLTQLLRFYNRHGQWRPQPRRSTEHTDASCIISQATNVRVLVWSSSLCFVDDDEFAAPSVVNYPLSLFSACYRLIKAYPRRFCHSGSLEPMEYVWNIHHEDWMRAHAVVVFTMTRQLMIERIVRSCQHMSGAFKLGRPYHMSLKSEIFGYATSEQLAYGEHFLRDPVHDATEMQQMSERATSEEIGYVLQEVTSWRLKSEVEQSSIMHETGGTLAELVTDAICTALDAITPNIDWHNDLFSSRIQLHMAPMDQEQLLNLKTWLTEQVQQARCGVGEPADTGDKPPPSTAYSGPEKSREMQALLGYTSRLDEDLEDICGRRGFDVDTVARGTPNDPRTGLQAPHISDADRLAQLLAGPLRCAMLFSQCGTGKTRVMLLAIKFLMEESLAHLEFGPFKPNVIIMPLAKFGPAVRELELRWHDVFSLWVLCHPRDGIQFPDHKTIDSTEKFQQSINEWAARRRDDGVARVLLLASYESWLEFSPVAKDSQPLADGKEAGVQKGRERDAMGDPLWNVVALDECQVLQDNANGYRTMVTQLDREALLLVSAYPFLALRDMYTYLRVLWNPAWPFGYHFDPESDCRDLLHAPTTYRRLILGEDIDGITLDRLITAGSGSDSDMYEGLTHWQKLRCDEFKLFVLVGCGPAYLLHPELFSGTEGLSNQATALLVGVTRQILEMMSVRRGMFTPMMLPDGRITCLGEGVGRLAVRTVELIPPASVKQKLCGSISRMQKFMPGTLEQMLEDPPSHQAAICQLSMISTDVKNVALTFPTKRLIRSLSILQEGVLKKPITIDTTGGLEWLFYNTRESVSHEFPPDKLSQVKYVASDSPKYCHVLLKALQCQEEEERLLIFTNSPLTGRHVQADVDRAVRVFSHKFSPFTCLVTTFQVLGLGVGLHDFCHRGIIMELPQNHAMLFSAMGRIWRVGQEKDVDWEILIAKYSFDSWIETGLTEQYARILAVLGGIDEAIVGDGRRLSAYEIIREQLGQEYSRGARGESQWDWAADDDWRAQGEFASALGRFCLKHPEKARLIQPDRYQAMLRVWKVGMEITLEMVEGKEHAGDVETDLGGQA
ncbi:hypothetical protein J3F83DRAFT_772210 [Trichoderma novae-zelandiae]